MNTHLIVFSRFLADEEGVNSIEYGLIAVVVSVGIIVSLQYFASTLNDLWNGISSTVLSSL